MAVSLVVALSSQIEKFLTYPSPLAFLKIISSNLRSDILSLPTSDREGLGYPVGVYFDLSGLTIMALVLFTSSLDIIHLLVWSSCHISHSLG